MGITPREGSKYNAEKFYKKILGRCFGVLYGIYNDDELDAYCTGEANLHIK